MGLSAVRGDQAGEEVTSWWKSTRGRDVDPFVVSVLVVVAFAVGILVGAAVATFTPKPPEAL